MRKLVYRVLFCSACIWLVPLASSEDKPLYRCTSPSGQTEFSDNPCGTNAKIVGSFRAYSNEERAALEQGLKRQQSTQPLSEVPRSPAMPLATQPTQKPSRSSYETINGKPYFKSGAKGIVDPATGRYCPLVGNTYFCN